MQQQYFIVVFAHSLHGRLRRVHIPHQVVYGVMALALLGCFSLFGFLSSYLRMVLKVANYNSLRQEVDSLRTRYQNLEKVADQRTQQLATLQLFASEVSVAYGIKRKLEGPNDISHEGRLVPTMQETFAEYDFLRSARISSFHRPSRLWRSTETRPFLWPVASRLLSRFGERMDPFSGEGAFHRGIDLAAPLGTPIRAASNGVVLQAEWMSGYGRLVVLDHGGNCRTYYAHLSGFDVVPGQEVRAGETIGRSGRSGRATAPHLHYEVRMGGIPINPYQYLQRAPLVSAAKRDFPF